MQTFAPRSLVVVLLLISGAGCEPPPPNCNTSNCAGCCDSAGSCQGGFAANACGIAGLACASCSASEACVVGACVLSATSDAGVSDAGAVDGGAVGGVDAGSDGGTDAGVDAGIDAGIDGGTDAGTDAGVDGGMDAGYLWCGAAPCDGCCSQGQCVAASSQSAAQCGVYRSECRACPSGESCAVGQCVPPSSNACLVISPDEHDFRTLKQGCNSAVVTFTVFNACDTAVTLNNVNLIGTNSASFTLTPFNGPLVLNGFQSSTTFQLRFTPTTSGANTASVVVNGTESGQATSYRVPVFGNSASIAQAIDTFVAPTRSDVLMIIDDSCSLAGFQRDIATGMDRFVAYPFDAGVDFNVAAIGTDQYASTGVFTSDAGHDPVVTSQTPRFLEMLRNKAQPGTNANGNAEASLRPAFLALSPALLTTTNAGFLRWDAQLGIAAFSDAPDQSFGSLPFYLAALRGVKGAMRPNDLAYNVVAGFLTLPPRGCGYDVGPDNGRYAAMLSATAGVQREYCTFAPGDMLAVGEGAFGRRERWFLLARPDTTGTNTVSVTVDGVPTAATYDPISNSVLLSAPPRPGQTVAVTYNTECL